MKIEARFTAGMPHLDIFTLIEDWALATATENHWQLMAKSLGLKPSQWIDNKGDRMYCAIMAATTSFDLDNPVLEDDEVAAETKLTGIRKPHATTTTRYLVDGKPKAEVTILSSFIKRKTAGSNKKFSKVRDLWTAEDFNGEAVDAWLDKHHDMKDHPDAGDVATRYEVNRIQDFNAADFVYFKNFIRIAKAAEWIENRGNPTQLNFERSCFFYGNVDDGDIVEAKVNRGGGDLQTTLHADDGRRIFLTLSKVRDVEIPVR